MKVIPKGQVVTAKTHLIYGESQVGKTTLIGKLARDLHSLTGQSTRLIMSDQGGFSAIKPEIDE
jgi:GTPase SAR1 family protein